MIWKKKVRVMLAYHRTNDARDLPINMRAADFEAQLARLKELGFESVTLSRYARYYVSGDDSGMPQRAVVFAFDDGYLDNYKIDAPLLRKYGFTGVFFVPTLHAGTNEILPHDAETGGTAATDTIMSWEQAREMISQGMEIGGHTRRHAVLTEVDSDTAWEEINGCMLDLKKNLGEREYFFCYPKNKFDAKAVEMAKRAGFAGAALTQDFDKRVPPGDPFLIKRVGIQRQNPMGIFELKVFGWYDLIRGAWWWRMYKRLRK